MSSAPAPVPLPYSAPQLERDLGSGWAQILADAYRWMLFARALDERMVTLQRQGRVGFYGPATGQEAVSVAAGLVTRPEDWIFPGLREQLVALVRGHPLAAYAHHLFADAQDPAQGRQMPCHPTAREVRYVSMSSCVGTQITHAVGCAYGLKLRKDPGVALAFFGDGGTSVNDFHAGLNFAGVWGVPVVFCCTNNQWAISVPVERQTRVHELAEKAKAYGLPGSRVDGTDFVAVHRQLTVALERVRRGEGPVLLEFLLYRMSAHTTSDDPARYQPADWWSQAVAHDPVLRLGHLLEGLGLLEPAGKRELVERNDAAIRTAIETAERAPSPEPRSLTEDVYASSTGAPAPAATPEG